MPRRYPVRSIEGASERFPDPRRSVRSGAAPGMEQQSAPADGSRFWHEAALSAACEGVGASGKIAASTAQRSGAFTWNPTATDRLGPIRDSLVRPATRIAALGRL